MTHVVWLMFAGTMASSRNPPPPPSPPAAAVTVPAGAVTATLELATTIEQLNALTEFQRTTFESDIVNYITRQLLALRPPGQVVITGIRAGSIVVRIPAWQRLPNGVSHCVVQVEFYVTGMAADQVQSGLANWANQQFNPSQG